VARMSVLVGMVFRKPHLHGFEAGITAGHKAAENRDLHLMLMLSPGP
jgi:hypothetical protein